MNKKRFETVQQILKVDVTFNAADLNQHLQAYLMINCKSLIPYAQTYEILDNDIMMALPESYEHAFSFAVDGDTYDFSFKGNNKPKYFWSWNKDEKNGNGLYIYHSIVTISKKGKEVFKQQDTINVKLYVILVWFPV
jgi:hypothetical protein